jgi:uncharacterized protein
MSSSSSRRGFLASGLALPAAAGLAASAVSAAPAELVYRTLGKTNLKVVPVGLGAGAVSDPTVVARAADMGVNYFDTARVYMQGNSERMIGQGLKGKRDKVVLVSKTIAASRADALTDIDKSLKELGTDHLDVWFLHAKDKPEAISAELVDAQETVVKAGKARFIGVSTHDPAAVVDHIIKLGKHQVVLFTYNFTMGTTRDAAIAKFQAADIGLVAMKTMAPAGQGEARAVQIKRPGGPLAALKWALKNPAIATTIPSTTDVDQLEENFRAITEKFGAAEEKTLTALNEEIRPNYCRMCYQCDGLCPKGVPVPNVLRYLAYSDFYGDFPQGRSNFLELPEHIQQVRCGDCADCAIKCPNGVKVQQRLIRAQELFA